MTTPDIPVLDLHDLADDSTAAQRARAAQAIRVGLGEFGLVFVRNHGVPHDRVLELYDLFEAVLARPTEEKATWGGRDIWYQRGWTPPNTEQAVVAGGQPDFKECYFAAPIDVDPRCRTFWPEMYGENVWPRESDAFRELYLAIGRQVHAVGADLLRGCALALDLPEDELTKRCDGGAHVSRLLKYLPLREDQVGRGILWGEEHTDLNLLTLLPGGAFYRDGERRPGPGGSGLKLRTRPTAEHPNGRVVPGRAPEGCLVAQVGQQLEVLTGGRLLATPHVITAPDEPGWSRMSFAHFVHLNGMQPVVPLPPFSDADADYAPPVLAGTYVMKTLVDIGLAPRSAVESLGYRHYDRLATIRARET
jgi:isopenicillin N synthase-like dioxygenase